MVNNLHKKVLRKKLLIVSILVFSGADNILKLLDTLPDWLAKFAVDLDYKVTIIVRSNNPRLELASVRSFIENQNKRAEDTNSDLTIEFIEGTCNLGFGAGHNANFTMHKSDFFLILNDDIGFPNLDWLPQSLQRFESDAAVALIADDRSPRYINPFFGNGMHPSSSRELPLTYAEASVLIVRSAIFAQVGMFDEAIEWVMSEDSDLSFRIRQLGKTIEWMSFPHEHWRSTSINALPSFTKHSIIEHNRAQFFAKWGEALRLGRIGNYDLFDLYSDGIGDTFCALFHISAYIERLVPEFVQRVVVNTNHPHLAALILPDGVKIENFDRLAYFVEKYHFQGINNIRSTRPIAYCLPFNIHSLLAGVLATPIASDDSVRRTFDRMRKRIHYGENFKASTAEHRRNQFQWRERLQKSSYCVVHLEFLRKGQDGRSPSEALCNKILEAAVSRFETVVVVGLERRLTFELLGEKANKIVDLQSQLTLQDLVEVASSASDFIGIDSFPAHVAQMAGARAAIFFGSINPLSRIWSERNNWPIVANLDCLGCYHDYIEPSVPFCMRRDSLCERAVNDQTVRSIVDEMSADKPYDWSHLRTLFLAKQAKMVRFVNHHPSPNKHLFKPALPNENISNLIYELTDRIISTYAEQNRNAVVDRLEADNARLQRRLREAENALAEAGMPVVRSVEGSTDEPADALGPPVDFWALKAGESGCVIVGDGAKHRIQCLDGDPKIFLYPLRLDEGKLFLDFTVSANVPTNLKIYWSNTGAQFHEKRTARFSIDAAARRHRWSHVGQPNEVLYLRLDPAELECTIELQIEIFGNIRVGDSALSRVRNWVTGSH
jgi:GT2 family glycosyltransferase